MSMTCTDIELLLAQQEELFKETKRVFGLLKLLDQKIDKLQSDFDDYQNAESGEEEELWEEEELSEDSEGSSSD